MLHPVVENDVGLPTIWIFKNGFAIVCLGCRLNSQVHSDMVPEMPNVSQLKIFCKHSIIKALKHPTLLKDNFEVQRLCLDHALVSGNKVMVP